MSSVIRNFIVTFCVSLLIFGLLSYAIVSSVDNVFSSAEDETTAQDTSPSGETEETPGSETGVETDAEGNIIEPETDAEGNIIEPETTEGREITLLLVGTDYQPNILNDYDFAEINKGRTGFPLKAREVSADSVMLIKIDETAKEFVFSVLPADMKVQADGGDVRLGSLYSLKGIHYMRNKVTAMTGLTIDFYAVVSIPGFTAVIDELGGINMTVPVDMNYADESQQLTIRLNKGAQTLSGTDAVNMLRYKLYSNGDTSRRAMAVTFARALLRKMTVPAFMTQSAELYSSLSKYIETDFTLNDLSLYLDLIFLYPEFTSTEINYPGTAGSFDGNTYFEPDLSSAISLYRKYR